MQPLNSTSNLSIWDDQIRIRFDERKIRSLNSILRWHNEQPLLLVMEHFSTKNNQVARLIS